MHIFRHIAVLVVLVMALTACSSGESAEKPESKVEPAAAAVSSHSGQVPDMGAAELDAYLKANKGTATMVMLWATWCPSCKDQIPELEKLVQTHGDKVNVIAMSLDENKVALERYLAKKPMDLHVVWGDEQIARDHQVEAIPTLLIFDKNGQKIFGQAGVYPASMLGAMVNKLAGE